MCAAPEMESHTMKPRPLPHIRQGQRVAVRSPAVVWTAAKGTAQSRVVGEELREDALALCDGRIPRRRSATGRARKRVETLQVRCDIERPQFVLEIFPADRWPSRRFRIHWFGPIFGIIGMLSHSRKEAYWHSRRDCAGDSIESVKSWAAYLEPATNRGVRSCVPRAAHSWERMQHGAINAAPA